MSEPVWKVEVLLTGSWRGATSVLVSHGKRHMIVDTGMPHETPQLLAALEARGLGPSDIETVINTHFHVDHVLNNSLFASSFVFATQKSYDWCRSLYSDILDERNWEKLVLKYYPETHEYARARSLMGGLRRIGLRWWDPKRLGEPARMRWLETHRLPDGLQTIATHGHVPGHISVIVPTPEQATIIAGDALLSRDHDDQILTMIPHNRNQFRIDRERILEMTGTILPGHDIGFSTVTSPGVKPKSP